MPQKLAMPKHVMVGSFQPETALDNLFDAVIVIDHHQHVLYANSSAEHLFSLSRASFIRNGLTPVLGTEHPLWGLIERVRSSNHSLVERNISFQRPGFGAIHVNVRVTPMDEGHILLTFIMTSEALRHSDPDDTRGHRQLAGMAAVLAHEVKNPLAGIRGAAQLMERYLPENSKELSRLITRECDRITHLVDEMDSFGNEKPADIEAVNIHEILDHVITLAASSIHHKIAFERVYDPSLPHVAGNGARLIQICLNIVKNGIEATLNTPSPKITIETAYRHGVRIAHADGRAGIFAPIEITITDNGSGVNDELKPFLFEAFVTTKAGGRGLGLALVARYLSEMGGSIEHFSSDAGTHFRIHLAEERSLL